MVSHRTGQELNCLHLQRLCEFLEEQEKKALCLAKITTTRAQSTSGDSVYSASKEPFKSRVFFFPVSWQVQEPE